MASAAAEQDPQHRLEGSTKEEKSFNSKATDEDSADDDASSISADVSNSDDVAVELNAYIYLCCIDHDAKVDSHGQLEPFGLDINGNPNVPEGPTIAANGSSIQIDLGQADGNRRPVKVHEGFASYRHRSALLELTGPLSARAVLQAIANKIRHELLRQKLLEGMLARALDASSDFRLKALTRDAEEYWQQCGWDDAWFYSKTMPLLDAEPDPMTALTAPQLAQLNEYYERRDLNGGTQQLVAVRHVHGNNYEVEWSEMFA
ncbi:hypothetical protein JKP88DRAFT_280648 [Tribonema minus]|uniref:Uncharacterized protein n=1 Tax=Tribonema minus TaxID=303371 RepID=A0A835YXS0_9STRA|nr:hypothetical protein JKP88DRAFT_280648 [Tribonema minus]